MINPLTLYTETGRKAARAVRHHDQGMVTHLTEWMRGALALESPSDQPQARAAYNAAYRLEQDRTWQGR